MEIEQLLINQHLQEIKNSLFYSSLASECGSRDLMGFANFFKNQSLEEYLHSKKILDHLIDRKISFSTSSFLVDVELEIEGYTNKEFIKVILNESLKREIENSNNFQKIMEVVEKEKKYIHQDIIMWFINEQVEEENVFKKLKKKFETSNYNIFLLDKELSEI